MMRFALRLCVLLVAIFAIGIAFTVCDMLWLEAHGVVFTDDTTMVHAHGFRAGGFTAVAAWGLNETLFKKWFG